jgi:hypothetical protein
VTGRLNVRDEPRLGAIEDFIASSDLQRRRLRAALPGVLASWSRLDVSGQIRDRAHELNRTYPVVDKAIAHYFPDSRYRRHQDLGRLRAFEWVEVATVVGGGVERWKTSTITAPTQCRGFSRTS